MSFVNLHTQIQYNLNILYKKKGLKHCFQIILIYKYKTDSDLVWQTMNTHLRLKTHQFITLNNYQLTPPNQIIKVT